jgi:hypothetical protein
MTETIGRPVKYIRLSGDVIYLLPKCYGSFPDSVNNRDCRVCPISVECRVKKPSIAQNA